MALRNISRTHTTEPIFRSFSTQIYRRSCGREPLMWRTQTSKRTHRCDCRTEPNAIQGVTGGKDQTSGGCSLC